MNDQTPADDVAESFFDDLDNLEELDTEVVGDFEEPGVPEFLSWLDTLETSDQAQAIADSDKKPKQSKDGEEPKEAEPDLGPQPPEGSAPEERSTTTVLLETLLIFAVMVLFEVLTGDRKIGAHGLHPHPYWLAVIPLAAARGLAGAFLSAGTATLLYAYGAWIAVDASTVVDLLSLDVMLEPLLFFAVAFLIGELRETAAKHHQALFDWSVDLAEDNQRLTAEHRLLSDATRELRKKLVDSSKHFGSLVDAATKLETADESELFDIALDLVMEQCNAARCSMIAVLEDGQLDIASQRGWASGEMKQLLACVETSPVVQASLSQNAHIDGFQFANLPEEGPILAAPITDSRGVVTAVLCLDEIELRRLNDSTVITFFGLADWITAGLKRIQVGDNPILYRPSSALSSLVGTWVGSSTDLGDRIRREDARCRRTGATTALIAVQATDIDEDHSQAQLDAHILDVFGQDIRPTDGIYQFGYPGCFVFVLAGATAEGAEIVRERLSRRGEFNAGNFGTMRSAVFSPDRECPNLRALLGRMARDFRENSKLRLGNKVPVEISDKMEIGNVVGFARQVRTEWSIALRAGTAVHLLELTAQMTSPRAAAALERHLQAVAEIGLRDTDGLFRTGPFKFTAIVPAADSAAAFALMSRLLEGLQERVHDDVLQKINGQVYSVGDNQEELTALVRHLLDEASEPETMLS